jgi:1,2-phenylacetyl-CoA epoxidase catalytic subunit
MSNEELRQIYKKYADEKIRSLGLAVPDEFANRRFL